MECLKQELNVFNLTISLHSILFYKTLSDKFCIIE